MSQPSNLPVSIAGWRRLKGDQFILDTCLAAHTKASKPKGILYCFHEVGLEYKGMTEAYMVRDATNRRLLPDRFSGRNAAHAYGSKTLKMPPNDGETICDIDCRPGITWAAIRATDGMTEDEMIKALT